jgi:PAS domain S-box-containing protein
MTRRLSPLVPQLAQVLRYSTQAAGEAPGGLPPAERPARFARAVMQASPVAMALADFDLRLLAVNPAFESLFGYRGADILGSSLPILINTEASLAEAMAGLRQAVSDGLTQASGTRRRQDGTLVEVDLVGARVNLGGGLEAVAMMYADVTAERQAEERLRLAEAALAAAANAIVIVGRGGEILWVNPAFTRLTGYSAAEAVGQSTRLLKSGRHDEQFYRQLWSTVLAGEVWHGETVNRRKDGTLYVEDQTIAPVRNAAGEIMHFISIKEDVSARKQAAEELVLARDAAETANRAKSTFLANMSHELRTPLNHIIGYAELLMETAAEQGPAGAAAGQDLQFIDTAAHQLLGIISDVLELSKLEMGRVELAPEAFDPAAVVRELAAQYAPAASKNGNHLVVNLPPDLGRLQGDAVKMRRVLDNLVSNACKFTEHGEITLAAERHLIGRAAWLKFTVADTGVGIPADKLELIFQPFVQADSAPTRKYGGTGLGLAVAHKLCELMGGEIAVKSTVGQGTLFTVLLPGGAA